MENTMENTTTNVFSKREPTEVEGSFNELKARVPWDGANSSPVSTRRLSPLLKSMFLDGLVEFENLVKDPKLLQDELAFIFVTACTLNLTSVVKCMLQVSKVDVTCCRNEPLRTAVKNNNLEIVQMLMTRGADPTDCDHNAFMNACREGYVEIVKELLIDPRININFQEVDPPMDYPSIVAKVQLVE